MVSSINTLAGSKQPAESGKHAAFLAGAISLWAKGLKTSKFDAFQSAAGKLKLLFVKPETENRLSTLRKSPLYGLQRGPKKTRFQPLLNAAAWPSK